MLKVEGYSEAKLLDFIFSDTGIIRDKKNDFRVTFTKLLTYNQPEFKKSRSLLCSTSPSERGWMIALN